MTTLRVIQDYFARLVTHPTGAADGLSALHADDPGTPDPAAVFGETPALSALQRIDIYANMYFFRLLELLEKEYPKVSELLGHDRFHDLAADFLAAHPSRFPDIGRVAGPLPDFLRIHPAADFPGLHELAVLEQTRSRVFIAANPPLLLTLADLQALPPEALGTLAPRLIPAFALLSFKHPVHELWQAVENEKDLDEARAAFAPRPVFLRVWREGFRVFHREIAEAECKALQIAQTGGTFAGVCESLADRDDPAAEAAKLLMNWIGDGLLVNP